MNVFKTAAASLVTVVAVVVLGVAIARARPADTIRTDDGHVLQATPNRLHSHDPWRIHVEDCPGCSDE